MVSMRIVFSLLLVGSLLGCGEPGAPPAAVAMSPEERARAAVARRLELPVASVTVISATPRDFRDSSLDCPEPDMAYQQVITPGYQVIIEADGRRFDVRVAGAAARICHRRKGRSAPPSGTRSSVTDLADVARSDLAARLPAAIQDISVLGVRALRPGDGISGCVFSCAEDEDICGYAISLLHDSRRYEYLAKGKSVQPCPAILPG